MKNELTTSIDEGQEQVNVCYQLKDLVSELLNWWNEKVTNLRGSVDEHRVKVEKELEELRELLKNQKVGNLAWLFNIEMFWSFELLQNILSVDVKWNEW